MDKSAVDGVLNGAAKAGALKRAISNGNVVIATAAMAGRCENPVTRVMEARDPGLTGEGEFRVRDVNVPYTNLEVQLRCRKCQTCLRMRARKWRQAAQREMLFATRTWFGTLTLRPEAHAKFGYLAAEKYGRSFDGLLPLEQLPLRHNAVSVQLTLALKRLRKSVGSFRYLLVCEAHKSGLPHYHMLVHEVDALVPVRKSVLNDFWTFGFSQWRLANPAAAHYVSKYLSKAALARVRASLRYGSGAHPQTPLGKEFHPTETVGKSATLQTYPQQEVV